MKQTKVGGGGVVTDFELKICSWSTVCPVVEKNPKDDDQQL